MKIVRLNLDAFGPFSGESLDLSAGRPGLHLVYGPNEAGKTSTLRAIGNLLYGIPLRSTDNFVFEHNKMRLSATLEHSDGSTLEFVRFKRIKTPLCEADGATPIDQARLDRFLGGVDESMFETMFGIGHNALIKGGKEILNGGGKLGELLFSASSGIAGLKGIQDALQADREALFTDRGRGRVQKIPLAIEEVRQAQAKIKEVTVTTEEWSRQDEVVREARIESKRLDDQRLHKAREATRLRRIQGALKLFPERAQLLEAAKALGEVILLGPDFADLRRKAENARDLATHELDRARLAIESLTSRLSEIEPPGPLLGASDEIEEIQGRRGEYRKAQTDRPLRVRDLQEHEHAARDILESLGRPRDLAAADALHLRADDPTLIQQLASEATRLETRRDEIRETIARHHQRSEKIRQDLGAQDAPIDLETSRATVKAVAKLGDLEARRDEARSLVGPLEKTLKTATRRLPGWSGSIEDLEDLAPPLPETIERSEARFLAIDARDREREADRSREVKAIAELEARLQSETLQRDLPTEDDLARSRQSRDEGWKLIRRSWLDRSDDPDASAAFVARRAPGRTLSDAFEQEVSRSDTLADRLRREAGDVARRAEQLATLEGHRSQLARIAVEDAEAREARQSLTKEWEALTAPVGLTTLGLTELRSWLAQRDKVFEALAKVRQQEAEVDRLDRQIADQSSRISAVLDHLGVLVAGPGEKLAALVDRAQGLIARHEGVTRRRERLEEELAKEEADLKEAEAALILVEGGRDESQIRWSEIMGRIGLESEATPEQALIFVEKIRELRTQISKAQGFRSRINGIDRDGDQFAADLASLVGRVAPDLAGQPPDLATGTLYTRLMATRDADVTIHSLLERIEVENQAIQAAEESRAKSGRELLDLCRQANCSTVEDLPEAERRSQIRSKLELDLKRCEQQIRDLSAGASIEAFIAEAGQLDPDGLDLILATLDDEVADLQRQILQVNQKIGAENQLLEAIDGSGKAAEANEQAGYALARLQTDVPRYAALRIAAYVLQQGIERYRERAQGPLIRRAGQLFATLTAGSFGGLKVDSDEKGNAVLVGVRPDGVTPLDVKSMSDGSCDQLYLALRIASLENWLAVHEPIPLIVDDILLQFDNDRSIAALQVLAELARKTQVVFFTHHAHLIDLARAHLDDDGLIVHQLSAGRGLVESVAT